ncbi:MAG: FAD:protein FMN transferase [Alphaproteobacteria bacterium]|nr:FAD:protein FMN transferase [Alphaproteobacteria bacterium]
MPLSARAEPRAPGWEWRGAALGGEARIVLRHADLAQARAAVEACVAELERLENQFSLFRPHSAICRLNRDGVLERPSLDFRRLVEESLRLADATQGRFDPTVQPVWDVHARSFAHDGLPPHPKALERALRSVDWRAVEIGPRRAAFARPGMALTLNGIAQGAITDRLRDLLADAGFDRVLVDAGELRGLGGPWRVALDHPDGAPRQVELHDRAVATSSGARTRFDAAGRFNHILDPRSGRSPDPGRGVSVLAPRAAQADGWATALAIDPNLARPVAVEAIVSQA